MSLRGAGARFLVGISGLDAIFNQRVIQLRTDNPPMLKIFLRKIGKKQIQCGKRGKKQIQCGKRGDCVIGFKDFWRYITVVDPNMTQAIYVVWGA